MDELLELMRLQRHNFANHLQVISGLLQLKKYDRAFEYIKGVGEELNKAGMVARLELPQLVHIILAAELAAGKKGILFEYQIDDNLHGFKGCTDTLVSAVEAILNTGIKFLEGNIDSGGIIQFGIHESDGHYIIRLALPLPAFKREDISSFYCGVKERVEAQGWLLSIAENDHYLVSLTI